MSEQMFNTPSPFHAKLALSLSLSVLVASYDVFPVLLFIAARLEYVFRGSNFPYLRRAVAKMAKRQIVPVLSPHLCQYGGLSRVCRHILWRKSCNTVSYLGLSATTFGDKRCKIRHLRQAAQQQIWNASPGNQNLSWKMLKTLPDLHLQHLQTYST